MREGRSVNQIVREIENALGKPVATVCMPSRLEDVPYNALSTQRAWELLGWRPTKSFE
jgi:nucleoside-diphosphate-sugar epimerase